MMSRRGWASLALLSLGLACGDKESAKADSGGADGADGADGSDGEDPATVELLGSCPQEIRQGGFVVDSNEDHASASGQVSDGVVPTAVLTELLRSGDCTIWRRENPFCDPPCASGETCGLDNECVTYPSAGDLGTVTISGLSAPVSMQPVNPGWSYFDTSLDNPPWTAGDLVTLQTGQGAWSPVRLHGVAPVDLDMPSAQWQVVPGETLTVTWDAAPAGARTEVSLILRIDQHGLTPASLVCAFEDDGEAQVPGDVIDLLVGFGLTGFPFGELRRRTVDHSDLDDGGCMDFELRSSRLAQVEIAGYTPCRRDEDCPDGQTCNEPLERCE